ncbi:hypothetical protein PSN45_005175 [Yamadazyma tenuis]|uniref:Ubiquitin-domain-containing protein n=1 Tax=Candida tenuis (strain ATCC 10573 / BCRC 21748 / CBS 615 / JCM 9827 / NBRC 10315 / NRRL Y-1498 / VKM Y-70) TaxID=590646 RepID=G3B0X0_CANTC|nr:uncharacterized protein CANTEDRAFT_134131 [Yamadazyma tenuis ATCC 10573]EGV64829.1 hypothetical protein CANTEDRAFT_134131 [Yamadazyma tenuis ATCC 10573]WEJ97619.1 hypothetical protein PSN45_005175 [Yamadazyma tenuis]
MSESITVNIKSSGDTKYEVTTATSSTILELKEQISAKADVPSDRQRLIYSGKVLKDTETVASYKIQSGHTIHLVKSAAKAAATGGDSSTVSTTATDSQSTPASNQSSQVPSNISAGQGAFNPLADLTGARYAGYTQLPSASMFGPDGGMNAAMPDPEQMSSMMSNPMFQESMNSLLSNPQMLDYFIQQSPQLRALGPQAREMLQSPFFRQMLSNPEMMRSMMEMGRNSMGSGAGFPEPGTGFPAPGANPTGDSTDATTTTTNTGTNPPNPFASMFGNGMPPIDPFAMFGGAGGAQPPAETDSRPPEERYASQLSQLNDMGFFDFDRNVAALRRSGGNVQGAVEYLLSG